MRLACSEKRAKQENNLNQQQIRTNTMAMNVRRVVTGHDATGKSVILSDETLPVASRGQGEKIDGFDLWSTQRVPVDNSDAAEPGQRKGFIKRDVEPHNNYVRSGAGTGRAHH
jgi:hypothetical protein